MTTAEKIAYLRGLFDGFELDTEKKETKLFKAMIDILGDIATDIEDLEENALDIAEELDELSDDLALLEDIAYDDDDDDDDDCDCDCCCGDDDCDCDCDDDDCDCDCCSDEDAVFFEVKCPACETEITVDEDVLKLGAIDCPNCGEKLEFDISEIEDEDEE